MQMTSRQLVLSQAYSSGIVSWQARLLWYS